MRDDPLQSGRCSRLLRAVAHPERLRIVSSLRDGPRDVSEIAGFLGDKLANVSHHLQVLRRLKVLVRERKGRRAVYSLNPAMARPGELTLDFQCCELRLTGLEHHRRRRR